MPTQFSKPSIQFSVLVSGVALLAGLAFVLSSAGVISADGEIETSGQLNISGVMYRFAPTTCTVTDTDFLAAGSGTLDGEPIWISASNDRINLEIGPETEVDRPEDHHFWLVSVDEIQWQSDGQSVTATATLRDERDSASEQFTGDLAVTCPT